MTRSEIDPDHVWTAEEAAERVKRHPGSIRRACREGQLHGDQPMRGGHWLIEEQCLSAYRRGEKCPHKRRPVPRVGRRNP